MSETPVCPKCGAHLPEDAPAGLCPKCLVQAGFESEGQAGPRSEATAPRPASSGFIPPSAEDLARLFPQLEVLELLGKGGMGAVYRARQKQLDRLVAVKILPPEVGRDAAFAERFTREARAMARLSHPNIVAIYDFGRTSALASPSGGEAGIEGAGAEDAQAEGTLFYFIMEYVDGVNLRQAIQSGGVSPKEALAIVPQICEALQFAHDEGIVHRDIKPENILLDRRGRVKIADFGLAKLLGHAPGDVSLTGTQQVMGTLRYMAPEQLEDTKTVDHRADIYSLGVVFYELLTGELPIGRFAPPSKKVEIDVRLDEVVLRALEKEPQQRYQHASDVKTDVEAVRSTSRDRQPAVTGNGGGASTSDSARVAHVLTAMGALTVASGVFTFLLLVGAFVDTYSFDIFFRQDGVRIPLLVLQTLAIPAGILMVIGGLSSRPQGSSWSRFVAALGLVPLTPAWLITLPLGIWSLAVLPKPQVMATFARGAEAEIGTPPDRRSIRRRARLLATLVLWTAGLVGAAAYLLPWIYDQWWPWTYREHWETELSHPARLRVKVDARRRISTWGQHHDLTIFKQPWVGRATISLQGARGAATLERDALHEQWRWTPSVDRVTGSYSEPRPEFVVKLMKAAGIDLGPSDGKEEAATLIALVKDAANGVAPGGKHFRDGVAADGTRIGPFIADGSSGWGVDPEGGIGPLDRRLVALVVFVAIWLPGLVIIVRRHRRRLAAAGETELRYRLGTFGFWVTVLCLLGGSAAWVLPWVWLSSPPEESWNPAFHAHSNWYGILSVLTLLAVCSLCFLTDFFSLGRRWQGRAMIVGGAIVVLATSVLFWRLTGPPATVKVTEIQRHGTPQTVALVTTVGCWHEYELTRGSLPEGMVRETLEQRSGPGSWTAFATALALLVLGCPAILQTRRRPAESMGAGGAAAPSTAGAGA